MPSGLSQSHQEIAGQFQRELLQLICLGSGGQHVQRPPPRGMGRPIGLQCPCNSFTRQEVRGASDSTNQRIENNALVSSSGITGGARRVVYLVTSYSPVRGSAKDTRLRLHLDRQVIMVQTADGSPEEGASRNGDDMSNPMWAHIMRLLDDEEQAAMVCSRSLSKQWLRELSRRICQSRTERNTWRIRVPWWQRSWKGSPASRDRPTFNAGSSYCLQRGW